MRASGEWSVAWLTRILPITFLFVACAGANPPAEPAPHTTEPATKSTPAPAPVEKPTVPEAQAETPAPSASAEAPSEPAASSGPSQKPSEVLVAPMVAFILDYQASTPYEVADKNCEAEASGDSVAKADCMQKARGEFRADVLHFKKEGGRWWLIVYERKGSNLPEVFKVQFEFGDEKKDSVALRLKDTGNQGSRPFFSGAKQIVVSVPDDYSIRLNDPKLGRLVYNAKVGLVGK